VGANAGTLNLVTGKYGVSDNTIIIRVRNAANLDFIRRQLEGKNLNRLIFGSGQPLITGTQLKSIDLAEPGASEQRAIAEVLSDVDSFLAALEALISKKRAIKQAAMQQLLMGKARLPGFSGNWNTTRIGDQLNYERPDKYIVRSTEYTGRGDIPVLTANKSFILGYTDETFGVCRTLPAIVFDDFTTDCKFATFPFKVKSSAIKLLRPRHDRVNLRYMFERIQLIRFPVSDHKRYYISEYQHIELPFPDYAEQEAIVSVLSEMDTEVTALNARREKTRAIRQGMMQQLFTGRIRLVKPERAEANA
jgi:type I restriction enzyme S subunit